MRPGPQSIAPERAPGGLIIHVYNRAGDLLLERALHTVAEVQATAEPDAEFVATVEAGDVCIVVYDGDTGVRVVL